MERRAAWSAACGVVTIAAITAATVTWPFPGAVFAAVGLVALWGVFASLLRWGPWSPVPRLIQDGRTLLGWVQPLMAVTNQAIMDHWHAWQDESFATLKDIYGLGVAQDFRDAPGRANARDVHSMVTAQLVYVQRLRGRRLVGVRLPRKWGTS